MENRRSVLEGTDVTENILENSAGIKGVLSDPVSGVGIRAHRDDFAAQFLEPAEVVRSRQEAAAAVKTAGVQLQAFALGGNDSQNLVNELPVFCKGNRTGRRMGGGFADVGVSILAVLNASRAFKD